MKPPRWLRSLAARTNRTAPVDWSARPPKEAWQASIAGEVQFWENWLATRGEKYPGSYERAFNADLELPSEIADLLVAPDGATITLLDVGAGPLTFLGRTHPRWTLEITAVDALGAEYSELLDRAGLVPPVRTQTCESEKLTSRFPPDSFDLVAARNTLDHSYDPVLAISEMLACAKPGAPILLVHHEKTAENERYHGMHQWNFEVSDGTLIVWRPGQRTDVGEALGSQATFERSWVDGTWEHIVFRKA